MKTKCKKAVDLSPSNLSSDQDFVHKKISLNQQKKMPTVSVWPALNFATMIDKSTISVLYEENQKERD